MVDYTFEQAEALMGRIAGDNYYSLEKCTYTKYADDEHRVISYCVVIVLDGKGGKQTHSIAAEGKNWREVIGIIQTKKLEALEDGA